MTDDYLDKAKAAAANAAPDELPIRSLAYALIAMVEEQRKQRAASEKANDRREALIGLLKADRQAPAPVLVTAPRLNMVPPGAPGAGTVPPVPVPGPAEATKTDPSVAGGAMQHPNRPSPPAGPSTQAGTSPSTPMGAPTSPGAGSGASPSPSAAPANPVAGLQKAACRGCGADIWWGKKVNKFGEEKNHPFNANGTSHFSNCPKAQDFRGGNR